MKPANPFKRVFDQYTKVAITGAPKTGKTTLAKMVEDRTRYHSDSLIDNMGWSDQSAHIAAEVNARAGPLVVEGVTVPRALRKGMKVDAVIWLERPKVEQTPKQKSMGKAVRTVFNEWRASNPNVPIFVEPLEPINGEWGEHRSFEEKLKEEPE